MAVQNDNRYNILENAIVAAFQADAYLSVEAGIIHSKLREDISKYYSPELPAIAVEVGDVPDEETVDLNRFTETVTVLIEVVCSDASREDMNEQVKEIVAYIREWMRSSMQEYGPVTAFLGDRVYVPRGNGAAQFATGRNDDDKYYEVGHTDLIIDVTNGDGNT